ncbi:MAG: AAA family ATPase [Deltaproteobacteria bacterium]|nr:AAA family ATPase [Deltaproteobacteria bacterium]
MSYAEYFGLKLDPFSNAPDTRFYYNSRQHSDALHKLLFAIHSNKGLGVVIGGVGTGKTTLARHLLSVLPDKKYESSLLVMVHSGITTEWILTRIAIQLGVPSPEPDRLILLSQLYDRLVQIDAEGRYAVVLIDEAQMLQTRELMEEFRGLLNLEIPGKKLLNIIFFGLPEISDCLRLDEPLAQRVAVRCFLHPFTLETTDHYIRHRLQIAGSQQMLFTPEAVSVIQRYSGGLPRLINTLCDNCLFEAYLRKMTQVSYKVGQNVAEDLGLAHMPLEGKTNKNFPALDEIENMLDRLEQKL